MNKYQKWYNSIVENAKLNKKKKGYERHHIIPKSLGGSNSVSNLVYITAREHFVCHWLLTKIYNGEAKSKMIYALNGMKRNGKCTERYETPITSRVYEKLKKQFSEVHSATMKGREPWNKGIPITEDQRKKNSIAATGKKRSAEAIAKTVAKQTGQKRKEETKNKISAALKGKPKSPKSEEEKLRISNSLKGKAKPPSQGAAISATVAAQRAAGTHYSQVKIQCPHCPVQASKARYNAYHGDKCKHRDPT